MVQKQRIPSNGYKPRRPFQYYSLFALLAAAFLGGALVGIQVLTRRAAEPLSWFPQSGEAPGWTRAGETRFFEAADLWKYVDGDAERYLRAGVRRTLTLNYRYGETVEAVADIHLMEAPRGAASIFESESSAGSRPVALGDAGRSYGQSLTFRRGPFFVRLVAYQDVPQTEGAVLSLAQAIDRRLARP